MHAQAHTLSANSKNVGTHNRARLHFHTRTLSRTEARLHKLNHMLAGWRALHARRRRALRPGRRRSASVVWRPGSVLARYITGRPRAGRSSTLTRRLRRQCRWVAEVERRWCRSSAADRRPASRSSSSSSSVPAPRPRRWRPPVRACRRR